MEKLFPFRTLEHTLETLDNGGRFYNLLTQADDGQISLEELSKVAGLFSSKQKMALYFALSIAGLDEVSKQQAEASLTKEARQVYHRYAPQVLPASEATSKGVISSNAIVTGIPTLIESRSDFKGYTMMPIMTGKVMIFVPVPLIDTYDVYAMKDEASSADVLIAHARGKEKLPAQRVMAAGIFKQLNLTDMGSEGTSIFLETIYYAAID